MLGNRIGLHPLEDRKAMIASFLSILCWIGNIVFVSIHGVNTMSDLYAALTLIIMACYFNTTSYLQDILYATKNRVQTSDTDVTG